MCKPEAPEWLYEERKKDLDPELHTTADAEQMEAMRIADLLAERPPRPETEEEKLRRQVAEEIAGLETFFLPADELADLDSLFLAVDGSTGPNSEAEAAEGTLYRAVQRALQLAVSSEGENSEDHHESGNSEEEEASQGANPNENRAGEEQEQEHEHDEGDDASRETS